MLAAGDMSAWPAQNRSSQFTNSLQQRQEEAGDAVQSPRLARQSTFTSVSPGEGLLLLPG